MKNKRIVTLVIMALLLLGSFTLAQPADGGWWTPTPTGNNNAGSYVDKNLCITVFGVVSLALVIYLFKKKTFSMAENEMNTTTSKKTHGFHVSS